MQRSADKHARTKAVDRQHGARRNSDEGPSDSDNGRLHSDTARELVSPLPSDNRGYYSEYEYYSNRRTNLDNCQVEIDLRRENEQIKFSARKDESSLRSLLEETVDRLRNFNHGLKTPSRSRSALEQGQGHSYFARGRSDVLGSIPYESQVSEENLPGKTKEIDDDISDDESGSEKSLTGSTGKEYKTECYRRRWYILFLFSMSALIWNAVWSTWGPIAQSAKLVYDWTDGDIAMFTWLGNAPFLVTMFPIAYLMDVKGLRIAMLLCCGLTFLGVSVRIAM